MAFEEVLFFGGCLSLVLFLFIAGTFIIVVLSSLKKQESKKLFVPSISVVIPCFNEEKNISKCLSAIFGSDYPKNKMEIIVVDDGSTDQTIKIAKSFFKKGIHLRVIKGNHEGKSIALNLGIKASKNDFIVTIDADTFVDKGSILKLIQPLAKKEIGASNGSCKASNDSSLISIFQGVEYNYNNLVRKGFSDFFGTGIWFFGAFACYRKSALVRIGFFKKSSLAEDMFTFLELYSAGFNVVNVFDAFAFTVAPDNLKDFISQRTRWWGGVLYSLFLNKNVFSIKSNPSVLFLFLNQFWWSFYALFALPLLIFQFSYWLPFNMGSILQFCIYTFNWFSLAGTFMLIYKIPEWGISFYSIFGIFSGILGSMMIIYSWRVFKEGVSLKKLFVLFFYFPYTILLNIIILISLISLAVSRKKFFKD